LPGQLLDFSGELAGLLAAFGNRTQPWTVEERNAIPEK